MIFEGGPWDSPDLEKTLREANANASVFSAEIDTTMTQAMMANLQRAMAVEPGMVMEWEGKRYRVTEAIPTYADDQDDIPEEDRLVLSWSYTATLIDEHWPYEITGL